MLIWPYVSGEPGARAHNQLKRDGIRGAVKARVNQEEAPRVMSAVRSLMLWQQLDEALHTRVMCASSLLLGSSSDIASSST